MNKLEKTLIALVLCIPIALITVLATAYIQPPRFAETEIIPGL